MSDGGEGFQAGPRGPAPAQPGSEDLGPRRNLITLGIMVTTVMVTIDVSVVNVSLAHMAGNLSASPEQITWVLTAFIVAQAIMTPISGWLAARLGMKTMLLACVSLFTLTSVLCGMAATLPQIVLFRVLQGVTSAPMTPLSQAVLLNINPPNRVDRAMALFSMASVAGPIVGPVLGAYITDELSWRWCFYINIPTGALSLVLLWLFMPREAGQKRAFDFLGFGALAVGIAALQLMLDRGSTQDWFDSVEIRTEAIVSFVCFWVFVTHSLTAKQPLFHPGLARDRNFVASTFVSLFFGPLLFASVALLPLMMQTVLGYPVRLTGELSAPRGLIVIVVLQVIGRLDALVDRRLVMAVGLGLLAASFWLMGRFDLDMAPRSIVAAQALQGVGQALLTMPLSILGFSTLPQALRAEGASFSNLLRTLSGSIGIAVMEALTVSSGQRMHADLAAHVQAGDPVLRAALPGALSPEALMRLNDEITRQSNMVAFVDDFRAMAFITIAALPLLFLLRQGRGPGRTA